MPVIDWNQLRIKSGAADDADFALTQNVSTITPLYRVRPLANPEQGARRHVRLMCAVFWLDVNGDRITGTRGQFDAQFVVQRDDPRTGKPALITDSTANTALPGMRPFTLGDFLVGDDVSVRLTNITAAPGTIDILIVAQEIPIT